MKLIMTFILGFTYQEPNLKSVSSNEFFPSVNQQSFERKKSDGLGMVSTKSNILRDPNFVDSQPEWKQVCNVRYSLPSKGDKKKDIKVTFLGTCAEITFKKVSTVVKCKIIGNLAFVAFTVLHNIDSKALNAPLFIQGSNVQLDFILGKHIGKAKKHIKTFYYYCEDSQLDFGHLVEVKNGDIPQRLEKFSLNAGKNDYLLVRPCKFHWKNISALINKAVSYINDHKIPLERKCSEILKVTFPVESKNPLTKSSKPTARTLTGKRKTPEIILIVSGDKLIYEKSAWTFDGYNSELNKELLFSGLILTNTGVYTNEQRKYFKSLGLYIKSIQNLPLSIKEKYNVSQIYLEYSFPPICESEIIEPIFFQDESKLKIKDMRTFFNQDLPEIKLVEAIQNNMIVVKIMGKREKVEDIVANVWGQELACMDFSKRFNNFINIQDSDKEDQTEVKTRQTKKKGTTKEHGSQKSKGSSKKTAKSKKTFLDDPNEESVVIGYASISLYELLKYCFRMTASIPIHSSYLPTSNQIKTPLRPMNVMHFHKDYRQELKGIVEETSFINNKTSLKIEAKLGYDVAKEILPLLLNLPSLFTVFIIIDYDTSFSYKLLKIILDHNCKVLNQGNNEPGLPNILLQNLGVSSNKRTFRPRNSYIQEHQITTFEENQSYITGFMVDLVEFAIIAIECIEIEAIPKILVHRYQMLTKDGRMLYNSNLIFTERLYDQFTKFGGIFVSALGLPLNSVLSHSRAHEFVPVPALRCLKTIKQITTAKSIQRKLFPTPLELLSMDTEFGVPLNRIDYN